MVHFVKKNQIANKSTSFHVFSQSGFTLIELLVTMVVIGIIVALAAPSLKVVIANSKVKNAVTVIQTTLEQARAESFVTQKPILVKIDGNTIRMESKDAMNKDVVHIQTFDKSINAVMQSNIAKGVRFHGRLVQDDLGHVLKNDNTGFTVCHPNSSLNKRVVSVNPNNTITVLEMGDCS